MCRAHPVPIFYHRKCYFFSFCAKKSRENVSCSHPGPFSPGGQVRQLQKRLCGWRTLLGCFEQKSDLHDPLFKTGAPKTVEPGLYLNHFRVFFFYLLQLHSPKTKFSRIAVCSSSIVLHIVCRFWTCVFNCCVHWCRFFFALWCSVMCTGTKKNVFRYSVQPTFGTLHADTENSAQYFFWVCVNVGELNVYLECNVLNRYSISEFIDSLWIVPGQPTHTILWWHWDPIRSKSASIAQMGRNFELEKPCSFCALVLRL